MLPARPVYRIDITTIISLIHIITQVQPSALPQLGPVLPSAKVFLGAEVSVRHFGTSVDMSGQFVVQSCTLYGNAMHIARTIIRQLHIATRQFGTGADVSRVRSVLTS